MDNGTSPLAPARTQIVVGYVHVETCRAALDQAIERAREEPGAVVHVVRAIPIEGDTDVSVLDDAFEQARAETIGGIVDACERVGLPASPMHIDIVFGDPVAAIEARFALNRCGRSGPCGRCPWRSGRVGCRRRWGTCR